MALAHVQHAHNDGSGPSMTATFSAAGAGNLLVAHGVAQQVLNDPSGWTLAVSNSNVSSGTARAKIWFKVAAGGETGLTITAIAGATNVSLDVVEFSGFAAWALDKTSTNNPAGNGTTCATGSTGTLTSTAEVAVGGVGLGGGNTSSSWDSSFTNITGTTSATGVTGYRIVAASTALNPTATIGNSTGRIGIIATFTQGQTPVSQTFTGKWNVGASVTKTFTGKWNVGAPVGRAFTGLWNVAGPAGALTVRCEVAWDTDPLTRPAPGDWFNLADVSRGFHSLQIKRGVDILASGLETGTASAVFDNTSRALDPSYMTSPLSPEVKPRKRIRYVLTAGGADIPLHTGFIERYKPTWALASAQVEIPSQDLFGILANVTLPPSVIDVETRAMAPIAYWPLSETSGKSADDVVGIHDGTYTLDAAGGSPIVPYESRPANKLQSGGRGVIATGISSASTERCVSLWILADAIPAAGAADLFYMTSPSSSHRWSVSTNPAGVLRIEVTDGVSTLVQFYTDVIASGAVHHVVLGIKGGTNTLTPYVDGVAATPGLTSGSAPSFSAVIAAATTANIAYGTPGLTPATSAPGADFSNVALWDRVLTGSEADRLFDAGTTPWDGDFTHERADRLCDLVGVDPDDRDFDVCTQTCGPTQLASQNALVYFRKIVATEAGVGYVTGDGKIRLRARPTAPVVVQTFTDAPDIDDGVPCSPLNPDYSYDRVVNTLSGKRENNAEQTVVDPTSAATYGPLSGAGGNLDTLHRSAADLRTTLQLLINVRKNWGTYIPSVTVAAVDRGVTLDSLVHVEIGDLVSVRARPTGAVEELIFVDAQVEAVGYSFPAFGQLRTTYSLGDGVATEASFEWDTAGRGWDESYWLSGTPFAFDIEAHGWDSGFWTED